jgi:hypothetical protein
MLVIHVLTPLTTTPDSPYTPYLAYTTEQIRSRSICYSEVYFMDYEADSYPTYCVIALEHGSVTFSENEARELLSIGMWRQEASGVRLGDFYAQFGTPIEITRYRYSFNAVWRVDGWRVSVNARSDSMWKTIRFVWWQALR